MVKVEGYDYSVPPEQGKKVDTKMWMMLNLRSALAHYDVLPNSDKGGNTYDDYHPERLNNIPLRELRQIYGLSNPFHSEEYRGSIGFTQRTSYTDSVFVDIQDPRKQYSIRNGEQLWQMDFVPFGRDHKIPGLEVGSMYLGCLDLARMIDEKTEMQDRPGVILISTNAEAANFIANRWNFHLWGAVQLNERGNAKDIPSGEVVSLMKDIVAGRREVVPNNSLLFNLFASTEDLITAEFLEKLLAIKNIALRRGLDSSDATTEEEYEKELRVKAIDMSLHLINSLLPQPIPTRRREAHGYYHEQRGTKHTKANKDKKKMQKKSQKTNRKK